MSIFSIKQQLPPFAGAFYRSATHLNYSRWGWKVNIHIGKSTQIGYMENLQLRSNYTMSFAHSSQLSHIFWDLLDCFHLIRRTCLKSVSLILHMHLILSLKNPVKQIVFLKFRNPDLFLQVLAFNKISQLHIIVSCGYLFLKVTSAKMHKWHILKPQCKK